MTKRFEGKVLLATGAGSGLAAAVARRYTQEGGRVGVWRTETKEQCDTHTQIHTHIDTHTHTL
jgi:NAD(P)-dependent dehydrogenase (short-subunit alcohol dehydrogenase family)